MNVLSTCKSQGSLQLDLCPLCKVERKPVSHFLLRCNKYLDVRKKYFEKISQKDTQFDMISEQAK